MNILKKTALAAAVATAMGVSATVSADVVNMDFTGLFTMLNPDGSIVANGDTSNAFGMRTDVSGSAVFNTDPTAGNGTGTFAAFSFFGNGDAVATSIAFQAIGDGFGGPGTLVLANMGFNWNSNNGIPVSIVMDAAGFFGAVQGGLSVSQNITGSGATPASNNASFFGQNIAIGPNPFVTTSWNTTDIGPNTLGTNPSGTLPLIADTTVNTNVTTGSEIGVGGSPMVAGPFAGNSANFDFTNIHVTGITSTHPPEVPVPAAVWLFGSGLVGLVGVARRRKQS